MCKTHTVVPPAMTHAYGRRRDCGISQYIQLCFIASVGGAQSWTKKQVPIGGSPFADGDPRYEDHTRPGPRIPMSDRALCLSYVWVTARIKSPIKYGESWSRLHVRSSHNPRAPSAAEISAPIDHRVLM